MSVIGILFEKRIVDDLGFPRTPNRPVKSLGTRVRYPRSIKTTIGACGPDSLGGSATLVVGTMDGVTHETRPTPWPRSTLGSALHHARPPDRAR